MELRRVLVFFCWEIWLCKNAELRVRGLRMPGVRVPSFEVLETFTILRLGDPTIGFPVDTAPHLASC